MSTDDFNETDKSSVGERQSLWRKGCSQEQDLHVLLVNVWRNIIKKQKQRFFKNCSSKEEWNLFAYCSFYSAY